MVGGEAHCAIMPNPRAAVYATMLNYPTAAVYAIGEAQSAIMPNYPAAAVYAMWQYPLHTMISIDIVLTVLQTTSMP